VAREIPIDSADITPEEVRQLPLIGSWQPACIAGPCEHFYGHPPNWLQILQGKGKLLAPSKPPEGTALSSMGLP